MSLFGRNKGTGGSSSGAGSASAHPRITGRSCYDCRNCAPARNDQAKRAGQIYCRWDSEHYYPEAGKDCIDFNK